MSSGVLASYEGTNYINRVPTLMIAFKPKHFPKATPLNTITWEIRTLTCELRWVVGHIYSVYSREGGNSHDHRPSASYLDNLSEAM